MRFLSLSLCWSSLQSDNLRHSRMPKLLITHQAAVLQEPKTKCAKDGSSDCFHLDSHEVWFQHSPYSSDFHPSSHSVRHSTLLKWFISKTMLQYVQLTRCWTSILKLASKHEKMTSRQDQSCAFMLTSRVPPSGSPSFQSMLEDKEDTTDQFFISYASSHTG